MYYIRGIIIGYNLAHKKNYLFKQVFEYALSPVKPRFYIFYKRYLSQKKAD